MHDFIKNTNSAKMSNITPTFGLCQKYANARKIRFLSCHWWKVGLYQLSAKNALLHAPAHVRRLLLVLMTQETSHRILFIFHFDISHFIH